MQAQFRHALLGIQIRGILADDLLIDIQRGFAISRFEVVFPEGEIIFDRANQQTAFSIEISQMLEYILP